MFEIFTILNFGQAINSLRSKVHAIIVNNFIYCLKNLYADKIFEHVVFSYRKEKCKIVNISIYDVRIIYDSKINYEIIFVNRKFSVYRKYYSLRPFSKFYDLIKN